MDHIPWIEKYRPTEFEDIILEPINKKIMQNMLKKNSIPNMLFYGPPGTGKTTTIINIINDYQKQYNQQHPELVIHLNASDDRGIEIIRNKISSFTNASYLFNKGIKFIVLDEVDYMTKSAQFALSKLIKETKNDVRFFLISNYISKIEKNLQNLCMPFKFNTLPREKIITFLSTLIQKEYITSIDDGKLGEIISYYKSDVRSMINYIQGISISEEITPILTNIEILNLLDFIKKNPVQISERKFVSEIQKFNIEKHQFIIKIFTFITNNENALSCELIDFIRIVLHSQNYYTPDFNIFFISKLSELLTA